MAVSYGLALLRRSARLSLEPSGSAPSLVDISRSGVGARASMSASRAANLLLLMSRDVPKPRRKHGQAHTTAREGLWWSAPEAAQSPTWPRLRLCEAVRAPAAVRDEAPQIGSIRRNAGLKTPESAVPRQESNLRTRFRKPIKNFGAECHERLFKAPIRANLPSMSSACSPFAHVLPTNGSSWVNAQPPGGVLLQRPRNVL